MIKIVGQKTGKVYAEGYREDCFRKLHEKYPTSIKHPVRIKKGQNVARIYPEALIVIRKL